MGKASTMHTNSSKLPLNVIINLNTKNFYKIIINFIKVYLNLNEKQTVLTKCNL